MPNDSAYENYVVDSQQSLYAVLLKETNTTSHNVVCYTGYYTGGTPTVLDAQPFDVARDLSTGNLWQYTGSSWLPAMWNSAITFFLGGATTVCERLKADTTSIPERINVYVGTDDMVPAELSLSADDVAIQHNVGNYNVQVNVLRTDTVTDTIVDVPFPEGYVISTEDGNWTILKNFNQYAGFDYCTITLTWTAGGDGSPQVLEYVTSETLETALSLYPTSAEVTDLVDDVVASGGYLTSSGAAVLVPEIVSSSLVDYPTSAAVIDIASNVVTSIAICSNTEFQTAVASAQVTFGSSGFGFSGGNGESETTLTATNDGVTLRNYFPDGDYGAAVTVGVDEDPAVSIDAIGPNGRITLSAEEGATLNGVPLGLNQAILYTSDVTIESLNGGSFYICALPLLSLTINEVGSSTKEDYIRFTLEESGQVSLPAATPVLVGSDFVFEGGKSYLMAFLGGMMTAAEVSTLTTEAMGYFTVQGPGVDGNFMYDRFTDRYVMESDDSCYITAVPESSEEGANWSCALYIGGSKVASGSAPGGDLANISWDMTTEDEYFIIYTPPES